MGKFNSWLPLLHDDTFWWYVYTLGIGGYLFIMFTIWIGTVWARRGLLSYLFYWIWGIMGGVVVLFGHNSYIRYLKYAPQRYQDYIAILNSDSWGHRVVPLTIVLTVIAVHVSYRYFFKKKIDLVAWLQVREKCEYRDDEGLCVKQFKCDFFNCLLM